MWGFFTVRAALLLDKVLTEVTGLSGLFRDLHAASFMENRKKNPHAWKLLKSSHREKVNSFLMMSLFGFPPTPTGFLLPSSFFME